MERSGIAWTHVRPNFFMQLLAQPPLSAQIAAIAYVDARDVAAVLHLALVDERWLGQRITVSGPEALDHGEIARSISPVRGSPVRYVALGEPSTRERLLSRGFDPRQVERVLASYRLIRQGFCSAPTPRWRRCSAGLCAPGASSSGTTRSPGSGLQRTEFPRGRAPAKWEALAG